MAANRTVIVGVFEDRTSAQHAIDELRRSGFRDDQIGVAFRDPGGDHVGNVEPAETTKSAEGAVTGIVAGAGLGGAWAIGIAAGMLPAIGPVVAGGLLASILASVAAGAAAGGIVGALIGLGIPEEEARYYEREFHAGRVIVTVRPEERAEEASAILNSFGAYDVETARRRG